MPTVVSSIVIDAPPEQVWAILTDFPHWPDWNTWFTEIRVHENAEHDPQVGTQLTFSNKMSDTAKPGTYNARLVTWEPNKEFAWEGGPLPASLGWVLHGHHSFKLLVRHEVDGHEGESEGGGMKVKTTTLFEHEEGARGILSGLVPGSMLNDLRKLLARFNGELKSTVEKSGAMAQTPIPSEMGAGAI